MALRIILNKSYIQFPKCYIQPIFVNSFCNKNNKAESKDPSKKKEEASKKLNYLLQSIIKDDNPKIEKAEFSKPKPKNKTKIQVKSNRSKDETKIIKAAEDAAKSLGGNIEKTKSELISRLLSYSDEKKVDTTNMSQLISNMKVESQTTPSRSEQARQILKSKPPIKQRFTRSTSVSQAERLDLFGGDPLNIFSKLETKTENLALKTWEQLQNRELRLAVTHPPSNYYQQMILWTEQGKLWQFPIDNEQGMEDEQNVYFADHVFLEPFLDDWCPRQGPIRHFMELVCVGLSKNHFLTATEKRAHIEWFKSYFSEKIDLLKEVGAVPTDHTMQPEQSA